MRKNALVFNYGGGRQTVAICVLIDKGVLPRPDAIVMADTSRENSSTWQYLHEHTAPLLARSGLEVEIAPHDLATVDLYGKNGQLLPPVFTKDGKLDTFCSNEWKSRVVDRYLRLQGFTGGTKWLGLALEERRRWRRLHGKMDGKWMLVCPLVDKMLDTATCLEAIKAAGLPLPAQSACWMCPHKRNAEWRLLRDHYPDDWAKACEMDRQLREDDEMGGVFLHRSLVPLNEADIEEDEPLAIIRQCTLGNCFV